MTASARGVVAGEEIFIFLSRALASLADVFEKNLKKNKTTSVYKLGERALPGLFFIPLLVFTGSYATE